MVVVGEHDLAKILESLAEIYETLYTTKKIGFYRVLREVVARGVRKRTAALMKLRTIADLSNNDIVGLRHDYYIHLMKLRIVFVYSNKTVDCVKLPGTIPFLRGCMNSIPFGTLLTFYYPERLRPKIVEEGGVKHFDFYERVFRKTDMDRYAESICGEPDILFSSVKFAEHMLRELRRYENAENTASIRREILGDDLTARVDNKDLAIIKVVELAPLTTESMNVKLGIREDLYKKHLEHAERILRGIRIRTIKSITERAKLALFFVIRGDRHILELVDSALKYPTVSSAIVSEDGTIASIQILSPADIEVVRNIGSVFRKLSAIYGFEVLESYMGDLHSLINFTAPFMRDVEYSPEKRGWLERAVKNIFRYIKKS